MAERLGRKGGRNIFLWVLGMGLVCTRPGYLQDSKQVLQSFYDARWAETYTWVTLDGVSLYSNVPHTVAISAIKFMLQKYSTYPKDTSQFIILAIQFLLSHNFF